MLLLYTLLGIFFFQIDSGEYFRAIYMGDNFIPWMCSFPLGFPGQLLKGTWKYLFCLLAKSSPAGMLSWSFSEIY